MRMRMHPRGGYRPGPGPGGIKGPHRRMCTHAQALPECPLAGGKRAYRLGPRRTPKRPCFFDFTMWTGRVRPLPRAVRNWGLRLLSAVVLWGPPGRMGTGGSWFYAPIGDS